MRTEKGPQILVILVLCTSVKHLYINMFSSNHRSSYHQIKKIYPANKIMKDKKKPKSNTTKPKTQYI